MAKILVTGATGTVGSEIIKQLSGKGIAVRAAVHSASKSNNINLPNVEMSQLDYEKPKTIESAFKGIEKVFLLTPFVPNQVEIVKTLMTYAKKAGVKHIVRMSAFGADNPGKSALLRWHSEAEQAVKNSGIAYTIIRPAVFMQNFVNFGVESIKSQSTLYAPAGDAKLNFIDVRDIASVASIILTSKGYEGKEYNLTGPEAITHRQVASTLSKATGKNIKYVSMTDEQARQGMASMGMPAWMVDGMLGLYANFKTGTASIVTNAVKKISGKKPIEFQQFAKDYASFFK